MTSASGGNTYNNNDDKILMSPLKKNSTCIISRTDPFFWLPNQRWVYWFRRKVIIALYHILFEKKISPPIRPIITRYIRTFLE